MKHKKILILVLSLTIVVTGQSKVYSLSSKKDVISKFMHLSQQELLEAGNLYLNNNNFDTALVCYGLIIKSKVLNPDIEQHSRVLDALNNTSVIYSKMNDYRNAHRYLIDALILNEKCNIPAYHPVIFNNLGNIYVHFKKFDTAKTFYYKALKSCQDTLSLDRIYNNLGHIETELGNTDSAFYFLNKALQISELNEGKRLWIIYYSLASVYQKTKQYDSALHYYRLSLKESRIHNTLFNEVEVLSDLGKLFFKINKPDSALYYIDLSNRLANENRILKVEAENCLTLSKYEESKGYTKKAFEHYKQYIKLKDSVFNLDIFGDINQLQRLYEITKTNQQIEQYAIEQQINKRTIYYQKILWITTSVVLFLMCLVSLFIYFQKRNLNRAYKSLFEKNIEIIGLENGTSEKNGEKPRKSTITDDKQEELLHKILTVMEDTATICDPDFSLDKLSELVQSNQNYVSQVINIALKKNFRTFLNGYRIKEAQRLFSEPDSSKYTIETLSLMSGFKSSSAFRNTFKEVTGVSPSFYLKSIRENGF